ncbi:hypothetical protein QTP88_025621 [Uroleucon formosanum]
MDELKYHDSPKITGDQAIKLLIKHFPITVQAYLQTTKKDFLSIWEKLGEIENTNDKSFSTTSTIRENNVDTKSIDNNVHWQNQNRYKNQLNHKPPLYNNSFHQNPTGSNKPQGKVFVKQLSVEQESRATEKE